jgi:hypothetical protein
VTVCVSCQVEKNSKLKPYAFKAATGSECRQVRDSARYLLCRARLQHAIDGTQWMAKLDAAIQSSVNAAVSTAAALSGVDIRCAGDVIVVTL